MAAAIGSAIRVSLNANLDAIVEQLGFLYCEVGCKSRRGYLTSRVANSHRLWTCCCKGDSKVGWMGCSILYGQRLQWVQFDLEEPESIAAAIGSASRMSCWYLWGI